MSTSSYAPHTLVGNWYEDRAHRQPPQAVQGPLHRYAATPIQMNPSEPRSYVSHSHSCFVRPQVPAQPTAVAFSRTLTAHHRIAAAQQPAVDADARSARSSMSLSGGSAWGAGVGGVGGVGGAGGAAGGASTADERPRLRVVAFSAAAGKATSGASGERLRVGGEVDPACHSFVQRSWLPDRQHFHSYLSERIDCWTQSTDAAVPSP